MRRTGYFLTIAASTLFFNGCSGADHDKREDDVPVVQDLNIQTETSSTETSPAATSSQP